MPRCVECGRRLTRTRRTLQQKAFFADVFRCERCGYRLNRWRSPKGVTFTFIFSRYSHCLQCGTPNVHRMTKRDRVDSVSRHMLSILLGLSGAPLNKCTACRLQYHDWRRAWGEVHGGMPGQPVSSDP
jgi:hypothetical protein